MNRHERRKQRAQERKARRHGDTMGQGYSYAGTQVPAYVRNHPAFKEGQAHAASGERAMPPRYYQDIEDAARLIVQWYNAEPTKPDLRWVEEREDGTFIIAALDAPGLLADSPDAERLIAWLDAKTNHKLTLYQARWALRLCRAAPMPDGSYYGEELKFQSRAMRVLQAFAKDVEGKGTTALPLGGSPCGHCGVQLEHASGAPGEVPTPGCLTICTRCGGVSAFDEQMRPQRMTDEQYAALPEELRAQAEEMKAFMLQGRMARATGGGKKTVIEA